MKRLILFVPILMLLVGCTTPGDNHTDKILTGSNTLETGNTLVQTDRYQSGNYLYMQTAGLRFTLPDGRKLDKKNKGVLDTAYKDIHNNTVYVGFGVNPEDKNEICKYIPNAGDECSGVNENSQFLSAYDSVDKNSNGTYVLAIACAPGYCYHLVMNNNFNKPYNIGINNLESDSVNLECPGDDGECRYGWEPTFDGDFRTTFKGILLTAEKIK